MFAYLHSYIFLGRLGGSFSSVVSSLCKLFFVDFFDDGAFDDNFEFDVAYDASSGDKGVVTKLLHSWK